MTQLIISDLHFPYQDNRAIGCALTVGRDRGVSRIDIDGDMNDFTSLSVKFRDTPKDKRNTRVDWEIKIANKFLDFLTSAFPKATIKWYAGNHETRLDRYVRTHADQLVGVGGTVESLLRLAERGIDVVPYGGLAKAGRLYITHGDVLRKDSGASAAAQFLKVGESVIIGHTHRLGVFHRTIGNKDYRAFENGCLCRLDQPYLVGHPNWQQGFTVVTHGEDFHVEQVMVRKGKYLDRDGNWREPSPTLSPRPPTARTR